MLRNSRSAWRGIYMTAERAVMLVEKSDFFWKFCYLNSFCIGKSIILMFWVPREINSCFCSKTQRQMFGHVGTDPDGHQYGFTIQISKILVKKLLRISGIRKIAVTWILARVFTFFLSPDYGLYLVFLPSVGILNLVIFIRIFMSHCLLTLVLKSPNGEWPTTYTFFIYWTVLIFILIHLEWRDTENQQLKWKQKVLKVFQGRRWCKTIICLSLRLRQIIDLLATDKSRYFAQPRPIIVNCCSSQTVTVPTRVRSRKVRALELPRNFRHVFRLKLHPD